MFSRISSWFNGVRAFWRGPILRRGTVVRYARVLLRVTGARFDRNTSQWRYWIEGSSGLDYSEAAVLEMQQDYVSYMLKKAAEVRK